MKPLFRSTHALTLIAPIAFFAMPYLTHAQEPGNSGTPDAKPAPANPAATEKKKTKKIWTNDEIASVGGQISVVGTQQDPPKTEKPAIAKGDSTANADFHQKQVDRYKEQIKQYQAQIDDADKQIDKLKNFKAENTAPNGGINPGQAYTMTPPEDQVKQLEEKKKALQAKMEDAQLDARKNGVSSDELR